MELWQDYIDFLKGTQSVSILNAVFGKALSLHPKHEDFWYQAACFELETNGNSHAARILLQRSLRVNKHSERLWIKYFEMEVWYILKLDVRKSILGLEDESNRMMLEAPFIIFTHALTSIPNNVHFACTFHAITTRSGFTSLSSRIETALKTTFGAEKEVWRYLAMNQMSLIMKYAVNIPAITVDYASLTDLMMVITSAVSNCIFTLEEGLRTTTVNRHDYERVVDDVVETCCHDLLLLTSRSGNIATINSSFELSLASDCHSELGAVVSRAVQLLDTLNTSCLSSRLALGLLERALELPLTSNCELKRIVEQLLSACNELKMPSTRAIAAALDTVLVAGHKVVTALQRVYLLDDVADLLQCVCLALLALTDMLASSSAGAALLRLCMDTLSALPGEASSGVVETACESAIKSRGCSQQDRAQWCVYYIQIASCTGDEAQLLKAHAFVENALQSNPFIAVDLPLSPFYSSLLRLLGSSKTADVKGVLQRAVQRCPNDEALWDRYEGLLRSESDHKGASHVRWLRDNKLSCK
jgi:hypothetical protein